MLNQRHNGKYFIQFAVVLAILFAIMKVYPILSNSGLMSNIMYTPRTVTSIIMPINICRSIAVLSPALTDQELESYSTTIDKFSQQYKIDWKIVVAILKQESNFRINAVNYATKDFGIGQMHYKNIVARRLDLGRLLTDHEYAIHETFKILAELHKIYGKLDYNRGRLWYTRYHSRTPYYRAKYRALLWEHIRVIEDVTNGQAKKRRLSDAKADTERAVCGGVEKRSRVSRGIWDSLWNN